MLVFSRKAGETIVIPQLGITFKVIRTKSAGVVSIGIDAPTNIHVHRGEIAEMIQAESAQIPTTGGDHPAPVQIWSKKTGKKIASKAANTVDPNSKGQ